MQEGSTLFEFARNCALPNVIVEIGSWKCRSTICLALGSKAGPGKTVFAIDPHTGSPEYWAAFGTVSTFDEFADNVRRPGMEDVSFPLFTQQPMSRGPSTSPSQWFSVSGRTNTNWSNRTSTTRFQKVVEGGIVALHDAITRPGPRRVARDFVLRSRSIRRGDFVHPLMYA